jgi:hypothetical protein
MLSPDFPGTQPKLIDRLDKLEDELKALMREIRAKIRPTPTSSIPKP